MTDKMLLDVPCSGTGVMAKRADIRWRRSIEDILEMHLLQRKILWSASNYINSGVTKQSTIVRDSMAKTIVSVSKKNNQLSSLEVKDRRIEQLENVLSRLEINMNELKSKLS